MLQFPAFMTQYPWSTRKIPTSFLLPSQWPQPQNEELLLAMEEADFEEKCNEIRKTNSNLVVIGKMTADNDKEDIEAEDDDADNADESEPKQRISLLFQKMERTVDVQVAKDLLEKGRLCLDVRTVEEYNKGHVENALNVPYVFFTPEGQVKNPDFLAQVTSILKKEDHIVVNCNRGGRGLRACVDLLNAGFEHVNNMGGGYSAWVDSGFAGEKPPEELKIACKFRGSLS